MSDKLIKKFVQDANRSAKELLKVDESCPHGEESWYCTKCHDEYVAVLTAKVAEQAATIELASVTIAGQVAQLNSANEELRQQDETIRALQQVLDLRQALEFAKTHLICQDQDGDTLLRRCAEELGASEARIKELEEKKS